MTACLSAQSSRYPTKLFLSSAFSVCHFNNIIVSCLWCQCAITTEAMYSSMLQACLQSSVPQLAIFSLSSPPPPPPPHTHIQEHSKRAWSVVFNPTDPTIFASGSDDCTGGLPENIPIVIFIEYHCFSWASHSHLLPMVELDMSLGWFNPTKLRQTAELQREQGSYRVVQLLRTYLNHSTTQGTWPAVEFNMSLGWFHPTESPTWHLHIYYWN